MIPLIAEGIKFRKSSTDLPLDIIIAENIRNGADYFKRLFIGNGLSGDEAGLCLKHNLPCEKVINVFYSALKFTVADQNGEIFNVNKIFLKGIEEIGISKALQVYVDLTLLKIKC